MNTGHPPAFRVYLRRGVVAHVLRDGHSPNESGAVAVCGQACGLGTSALWHGTGSQDEIEQAAELPLCARCTDNHERSKAIE